MRYKISLTLIIAFITLSCNDKRGSEEPKDPIYQELAANFKTPERIYGVNCWWWWLNGNVTKEAITKDLEAMKSKNFQGAMVFDAGGHNQRMNKDIPAGPLFGSAEWNELFVFALDEAKRLGLEMGFNIQSGWNLGGPRVTPEYAAKQLTYSEQKVSGNQSLKTKLDQPSTRDGLYKDIAVLAIPLKEEKKTEETISDLELKLGFHELGGSAPDTRFLLENTPRNGREKDSGSTYRIGLNEVKDITQYMDKNGNLDWEVPDGDWSILRIGYTCTDAHVSTSSGEWQGRVLDYMSIEAFDFYWNDVVEPIFAAAGDHVGNTLKYMETDSWECGGMNWTNKFGEEFKEYRGYDLTNYLPIIAGYVVEDIEVSNAFLSDFRKTLGDLVAYNHYAQFQKYAHEHGMGIQPESAGPHAGPMDGIKNYGFNDIVMSEFWSPSPHRPKPENRFFLKQASSAAHIYGKKIVGAESFTTIGPHWNDELWHDQKSSFDHEICAGLNRMYFHTFTCSPPEMGLPGQEYFAGTHVNPQVTWWDQSSAFIDYMHRTQSIVQNGNFVADVLYYYGDHVPNVFPHKHTDPAGAMPGFDYDVTDETIFLKLEVKDGKIVVPGGVTYEILVLPDHKVLSLPVLKKMEILLQQGAKVIGYKPEGTVSRVGGQKARMEFDELANKIWGVDPAEKGEKTYGNGSISWGVEAKDYLLSKGFEEDFNIVGNNSATDFGYIHYKVGDSDVYFVSNQTEERQIIEAEFRVSGLRPEFWNALNGEIEKAVAFSQSDGITKVPLSLEPYGSLFVVFNERIDTSEKGIKERNFPDYKVSQKIDGSWEVDFDKEQGGPGKVNFTELIDWTKHENEDIKYFSGAATYKKSFNLEFKPQNGLKHFLELGSVKDVGIAMVKINGVDKGIVWTKPFRVDISDELKENNNELEITVVNSWYNRVAGDEISPNEDNITNTNIVLKHDYRGRPIDEIPLETSGLLGPLTITEAFYVNP